MERPADARARAGRAEPLKVALLMPVYNEVPWYVLGNARTMLEELKARGGQHQYAGNQMQALGVAGLPIGSLFHRQLTQINQHRNQNQRRYKNQVV